MGTLSQKELMEDMYGSEYPYDMFSNDSEYFRQNKKMEQADRKGKGRVSIDGDNYDTEARPTMTKGRLKHKVEQTLTDMMAAMAR